MSILFDLTVTKGGVIIHREGKVFSRLTYQSKDLQDYCVRIVWLLSKVCTLDVVVLLTNVDDCW